MNLESLRREIEEEERRVAALRREKHHRDALLGQIRGLINSVTPALFGELNVDAQGLMRELSGSTPDGGSGGVSSSQTQVDSSAHDDDVDSFAVPLFSKEMEERIMREEEPVFPENLTRKDLGLGHHRRRGRKKKNGNNNRKNKAATTMRAATIKVDEKDVCCEDPSLSNVSEREIKAKEAIMAALDSLQLKFEKHMDTGECVPSWLLDVETKDQQTDMEQEEGVSGGEEDLAEYSDDFEEMTDVE